jgi:hypothetical protein
MECLLGSLREPTARRAPMPMSGAVGRDRVEHGPQRLGGAEEC